MNHSVTYKSLSQPTIHKPIGQLLSEAGLISAQQIEIALREQTERPELKIGELFALHQWIKQETVEFFVERWYELLNQEQKKPLVYYFKEAALLTEQQIEDLLYEQQYRKTKIRFHRLAVQKGLIRQRTVDFFLENLLTSNTTQQPSFATPYELLKNYINGETNFQRATLTQVQLNHVTLKGVNLNNSNLVKAELKQANLNNSSFKQANLQSANLEKASLKDVNFEAACLTNANLTDAHVEGSNFTGADLKRADLRHAYLVNARFQGADLRGAKLQGAALQGASYDLMTCFNPDFNPTTMGMELSPNQST